MECPFHDDGRAKKSIQVRDPLFKKILNPEKKLIPKYSVILGIFREPFSSR